MGPTTSAPGPPRRSSAPAAMAISMNGRMRTMGVSGPSRRARSRRTLEFKRTTMKMRVWKFGLALSCGLLAVSANAATPEKRVDKPFADADHVVYSLARGGAELPLKAITNHGGGVLAQ